VSEGFGNTAWSTSTGFCSSVSGAAWSRSWSPTFSASASTGGFSVGSGAEGPSFGASSSPFCTWVISLERHQLDRQRFDVGDLEGFRRAQRQHAPAEHHRMQNR
jgi:hypothetical protein